MKTYMRPNLCQGFTVTGLSTESSATAPVPRISALEMNFCGSFRNLLRRDTLWSRGMCLNIQNTLLTRDLKQFQNKCSTFCTLIFLSQYDSDPKMPWFIISSHTDLKLKICLSLLSLRKKQTVATGELNWILEEHRVFGLQVIFSPKILDHTGYQRTKDPLF